MMSAKSQSWRILMKWNQRINFYSVEKSRQLPFILSYEIYNIIRIANYYFWYIVVLEQEE